MITRDQLLDAMIAFYEATNRPPTTLRLSAAGMAAVRRWPRDRGDEGPVLPTRVCNLRAVVDRALAVDYILE